MSNVDLRERNIAIARAIKKKNRYAAKLFAKTSWPAYLIQIGLLVNWVEKSDVGSVILKEVDGDIILAVCRIFELKAAGYVEFVYKATERETGFSVRLTVPKAGF